jgi:serine/threonine-protein kinase RsbW
MEPVSVTARAVPEAVPLLRAFVTDWARKLAARPEVIERLRVAASEAVSNAVVHAYRECAEPGDVRVTLERAEPDLLSVIVADDGLGMVPRIDSPGLGMGLPLIAHFADVVEIRTREPHGVELELSFDLAREASDEPVPLQMLAPALRR